ncbi:Mth938-like domain-containing protein [Candidatus Symbiobacter mobilis]|uniref:Uncharacterized protein n=1 Tax=Candidatus Symbiobacter mobilis CR TaxID=946483 RepID=U5N5K3_9BURK|nr:MTH938/NDUFAF3 family protein [Candidatus Symbiobacter mobilis]AGX86796.1 hypothetical protein Cenrod_0689 [Candidatus Symbiobacter mobilis CR]
MKLHSATPTSETIAAYGGGLLRIGADAITHSVVVVAGKGWSPWSCPSFAEIQPAHIEELAALGVGLVLLGTGSRQHFPHPSLCRALFERHIALECMTTAAACRTFNILVQDGRDVAAALIMEADSAEQAG